MYSPFAGHVIVPDGQCPASSLRNSPKMRRRPSAQSATVCAESISQTRISGFPVHSIAGGRKHPKPTVCPGVQSRDPPRPGLNCRQPFMPPSLRELGAPPQPAPTSRSTKTENAKTSCMSNLLERLAVLNVAGQSHDPSNATLGSVTERLWWRFRSGRAKNSLIVSGRLGGF